MAASKSRLASWRTAVALHGADGEHWAPRSCLAPPPEGAVREATDYLLDAADALLAGNRAAATAGIRAAELPDLLAWGVPVMSTVGPHFVR